MLHRPILTAMLVLAALTRGLAQSDDPRDDCKKNYETARSAYEIGSFEKVRELLGPCATARRKAGREIQTRIDALELLALADIAQDRTDSARDNIRRILELDPVFMQTSLLRNVVFEELLSAIRNEDMESKVSSVTKKPEDIRMASAHIRLIRRQEIIDRGYIDILDLLTDLPGFHVSRVFGQSHANVYQLGFRQENTERTLLMVDGVEENDLWSNWAYFSRQYPLSNIKAVEVIYGPASVMYGPRAFVGAVNIITLDPKDLARDALTPVARPERYKSLQLVGNVTDGGYDTRAADLTLQFRGSDENTKKSKFALQLTGRYYRSAEHDRAHLPFYDYDSSDIAHLGYAHLNLRNPLPGGNNLNDYVNFFKLPATSPWYNMRRDAAGNVTGIDLTPAGIDRARALDLRAYTDSVNGAPLGFSNTAEAIFAGTKLRIEDLQIGFNIWRLKEGYGHFQDINEAGSANGSLWAPLKATMYMKFEKRFFNGLSLTNLTSFMTQRLGRETARVSFISFGDPQTPLHFAHLLRPDSILPSLRGISISSLQGGASGQIVLNYENSRHGWRNRYKFYQAQQVRNETRLFYEARKWDIAGGLDLRSTQTQGDYLIYEDFLTDFPSPAAYRAKQDTIALAREKGIVESGAEGGNMYSLFDLGLYTMYNYRLSKSLRMSLGARADLNALRSSTVNVIATPRWAVIYHRPDFSVKVTAGSGYQGVSQATRFATGMGRGANDDVRPERIDHVDLSVGGRLRPKAATADGRPRLEYDVSAYAMNITDAVGLVSRGDTMYNDNIGQYRILGALSSLAWQPLRMLRLDANWTYTLAFQTDDASAPIGRAPRVVVGDIARHMANVSATLLANRAGPLHVSLNLRGNYMGVRPVGPGTTQSLNFGIDSAGRGRIPAYLVFHGNLGLAIRRFPQFRIDLTVQNLFDRNILDPVRREYFHPGTRDASGSFNMPWDAVGTHFADRHVPFVPQRGRFILLRLGVNLYAAARQNRK